MAKPSVASEIHQSLDIHTGLSTEVTLYFILPNSGTKLIKLTFI
jgi:hypothetical protein